MNIINEIENNRITYMVGIALSTVILGGIFKLLFTRAEKVLISRMQPPKTEAAIYFDAEMAIAMANVIPAAGVVADSYGKIVYVNQQLLDIFHWRKDEMIGQNLTMMIKPEGRARHNAGMEEWRKNGYSPMFNRPVQVECLMKGDIAIPVEITIKEMMVHNKSFVVGKIRDIRKQLEQIEEIRREANKENEWLRKEVEFYREIERETGGGMMKWMYSKDRVLMTKGMQALFELHQPECLTAATTNRVLATDRERVANTVLQAIKEGASSYELKFHLLNGKHIIIKTGIKRNKDGLPLIIYGIMHQIRE